MVNKMNKRKMLRWAVPAALLVAVAAAAQLGLLSFGKAQKVTGTGAPTVTAAEARLVKMTPKLALTGSLEGETSVIVSAKISGRIERVLVEDGQTVAPGQQLVALESVELANGARMANDGVQRAAANYDNAATDAQRYRTLHAQNAISRQQLDSAETRLKVAQAELSSAYANLSSAQQQYAYAAVTTPVAGVVANKAATVGQVVAAGQTLMTVENIRQVYAVVNIEQKDMGLIKPGLPAEVTVDTFPGRAFAGKVEVVNPAAGAASRMFRVKIKIDNPDGLLKPGMFVKAAVAVGAEADVLAVPQSAVLQKQGLYYVFVLEDGRAVRRQVEIGQVLGDMVQIRSGLTAGAPVVASNLGSLKDGDQVKTAKQENKQ